eukprot:TRINITY_DN315_c0_g1_i1.p1 TRINITY_DN315_c0_g1~~TRINITY_DN315_c0_g1_i1.p1  ORF type:complete len:461 (+),score=59.37 TRINITY_DN315_c0_g1_i1:252-1634(+)
MLCHYKEWLLSLATLLSLAIAVDASQALFMDKNGVKSSVFQSPYFELGFGSVENKYYYDIDFPRGHIGIKEFNAEVVDQTGKSIPLHETYLHHWVTAPYYSPTGSKVSSEGISHQVHLSKKVIIARNAGTCPGNTLGQYFGLGSETRRTATHVPDPYAIEVGNPKEIPSGHEERWMLNVHAIDTRGVEDRMGCTECRCDLYNVTNDEYGRPVREDYAGGLYCCYDKTQCRVKEGFVSVRRKLYLRYTVKWVDWKDDIVPVKIYIFDVTDSRMTNDTEQGNGRCKVEYEIERCSAADLANGRCIDTKKTSVVIPRGGDVIYGVAHQHSGGIGSTLYGQDGRVICPSTPVYGEGTEPGNEAGYIVGMSTCYPKPGSVKISDGEVLTLEANYNSTTGHTGVMGLFYILVADPPQQNHLSLTYGGMELAKYSWVVVFMGIAIAFVIGVGYRQNKREEDYQAIVM